MLVLLHVYMYYTVHKVYIYDIYMCVYLRVCLHVFHCQGLKVLVDSKSDIHLGLMPLAL